MEKFQAPVAGTSQPHSLLPELQLFDTSSPVVVSSTVPAYQNNRDARQTRRSGVVSWLLTMICCGSFAARRREIRKLMQSIGQLNINGQLERPEELVRLCLSVSSNEKAYNHPLRWQLRFNLATLCVELYSSNGVCDVLPLCAA